jgi:hypothetical protein
MHFEVRVAEIKVDRIGAGFDFEVMETGFLFHFHRSFSGSTDYEILGAREE